MLMKMNCDFDEEREFVLLEELIRRGGRK